MVGIMSLHMYCKISQLNSQSYDIYVTLWMLASNNAFCRIFIAGTAFARYLTIHTQCRHKIPNYSTSSSHLHTTTYIPLWTMCLNTTQLTASDTAVLQCCSSIRYFTTSLCPFQAAAKRGVQSCCASRVCKCKPQTHNGAYIASQHI